MRYDVKTAYNRKYATKTDVPDESYENGVVVTEDLHADIGVKTLLC